MGIVYKVNICYKQKEEDLKELINFCFLPDKEYDFTQIKKMDIDGIELLVYEDFPSANIDRTHVVGAHLAYWPDWLDFWLGKKESDKYINIDKWQWAVKKNIVTAARYQPEYMVWHVSNSSIEEIFTMRYKYDSMKVIKETANLFNKISHIIPENITVFFENLWHPGLTLTEPKVVDAFFSHINRKNVGIVLDTGHLMLTNPLLRQETQGVEYVCKTIKNLGAMKNLIGAVHLTNSLDKHDRSFSVDVPDNLTYEVIWQHLMTLDRHLPFKNCTFEKMFDLISPQYIVHELMYEDFDELEKILHKQKKCLGNIKCERKCNVL